MAQLCQKINQFQALNTRVVVISFGTLPGAQAWLGETCAPLRVFLDPKRVVYRAYELERSYLRAWGLKTMWRYVQLMAAGRKWRGIQGDSAQLGGDFIIDTDGIIRLAYRSYDPTDRPSADDLINCLEQYNDGHHAN